MEVNYRLAQFLELEQVTCLRILTLICPINKNKKKMWPVKGTRELQDKEVVKISPRSVASYKGVVGSLRAP